MIERDSETSFAFWTSSESAFTVTYSLELFHEIDFQVNEGYRRIPHGGVEVGGLLFGTRSDSEVRILACLPIACEHAAGPTFSLSDRDEQQLLEQLSTYHSNADLSGLVPVGWFVAHTRSQLRLNEREVQIFERFFPDPGQLTALVKPEKFQATRFAFLVRQRDGSYKRDGFDDAIILPLPGRGNRSPDTPVPSIAAPSQVQAAPAPANKAEPLPPSVIELAPPLSEAGPRNVAPPAPLAPIVPLGLEKSAAREKAPVQPPAGIGQPQPKTEVGLPPQVMADRRPTRPRSLRPQSENPTVLTTVPPDHISAEPLPSNEVLAEPVQPSTSAVPTRERSPDFFGLRLVLLLIVAAFLGCVAGYWAYLQLPPTIIPLDARLDANGLIVSWPVDQTRQAAYASIRVNDGSQQPLSPEERGTGAVRLQAPSTGSVKVELIVQHWMRDSRGIVRYIAPAASTTGPTAPPKDASQ